MSSCRETTTLLQHYSPACYHVKVSFPYVRSLALGFIGLAFAGFGDFFRVSGKRGSRGGWQVLKGSILSYRMSCVQHLAAAVKQVGIASKKMAEFPVSKELRTSQLIFLWGKKKPLNFFNTFFLRGKKKIRKQVFFQLHQLLKTALLPLIIKGLDASSNKLP